MLDWTKLIATAHQRWTLSDFVFGDMKGMISGWYSWQFDWSECIWVGPVWYLCEGSVSIVCGDIQFSKTGNWKVSIRVVIELLFYYLLHRVIIMPNFIIKMKTKYLKQLIERIRRNFSLIFKISIKITISLS